MQFKKFFYSVLLCFAVLSMNIGLGGITYSINFFWLNKDKDPKQKYVYPDKSHTDVIQTLVKWAKSNPSATVVFWYDANLIEKEAIQNTQLEIEQAQLELNSSNKQCIVLKNIRDLSLVKENAEIFSPLIPVYFRVDLVRMLAAYETLTQKIGQKIKHVFVIADLDVEPLFLEKSIHERKNDLEKYGIIMAEAEYAHKDTGYIPPYENSFQMVYSNANFLKALKEGMLEFGIGEAKKFLKSKENTNTSFKELSSEFVYELYDQTFAVFHHLSGNATCRCYFQTTDKSYTFYYYYNGDQIQKFGKTLFLQVEKLRKAFVFCGIGIDREKKYIKDLIIERIVNKDGEKEEGLFVPLLKVKVPPSRFLENKTKL